MLKFLYIFKIIYLVLIWKRSHKEFGYVEIRARTIEVDFSSILGSQVQNTALNFLLCNAMGTCTMTFLDDEVFSFTLYQTRSRVGRGNLLWIHTVPIKTLSFPIKRINENFMYFISSSGNWTLNVWRIQSHACTPAPRLA